MSGVWDGFSEISAGVSHNTVDRLKAIITGLNNLSRTNNIPKSGKKQDHIDRIRNYLTTLRNDNNTGLWTASKDIITSRHNPLSTSVTASTYTTPYTAPPRPPAYAPPVPGPSGSSSTWNQGRPSISGPITSSSPVSKPSIRFKPSPFYQVENSVSEIVPVPETRSQSERGAVVMHLTLNDETRTKLQTPNCQIRLYCTTSSFYTPGTGSVWSSQMCPIEFPPVCELRVNGNVITANTRGMKKKPGTAPPVDLGKYFKTTGLNRIDMTYVNNSQPFAAKKYYLLANVVRVTTVDQLVNKLRTAKLRPAEMVKSSLFKTLAHDDDIVAGAQTMSLKCPLSYMRLNTPCRSQHCAHPQCFDATSWYAMMEQTTTYLCPVCDKVLNVDDLIMDGYVSDILKITPDTVEDITIEPDGEWHTADGKFSSSGWKGGQTVPAKVERGPSPVKEKAPRPPRSDGNNVVVFIDSDDDDDDYDEQAVKHDLSYVSNTSKSSGETRVPSKGKSAQVIDLTFDSDDEAAPPPPPPRLMTNGSKRRGSHDFEDQRPGFSKRLRTEESVSSGDTLGGSYAPRSWSNGIPDAGSRGYGSGGESAGPYYPGSPGTFLPRATPSSNSYYPFNSPRVVSPPIANINNPRIQLPPLRSLDDPRPSSTLPPSWRRD